jgi:hypothetical protein
VRDDRSTRGLRTARASQVLGRATRPGGQASGQKMRRGPPQTAPVLLTWADRPCITSKKREISEFQALKYEKSLKSKNGIEKDYRDRARIKAYILVSMRPSGANEQPIALASDWPKGLQERKLRAQTSRSDRGWQPSFDHR